MAKYEFDNSGVSSSYLGLGLTIPIVMITLLRLIGKKTVWYKCTCRNCKSKNVLVRKRSKEVWFLALSIAVMAFCLQRILTMKMEEGTAFNPYSMLGVEFDTPIKEIKQKFQEKLHEAGKDIEAAKSIVRAFNLLKNKTNNIGSIKGKEVIAIPDFVLKNGYWFLLVYCLVIGFLFPRRILKKWRENLAKNKHAVLNSTTSKFYKQFESLALKAPWDPNNSYRHQETVDSRQRKELSQSQRDVFAQIRNLINFISECEDFDQRTYTTGDLSFLKGYIEDFYGVPLRESPNKVYLLVMDHLFRTKKSDQEDAEFVQETTINLISSMKEIATILGNFYVLNCLVILEKMFIQAVFDPEYFEMQDPENSFNDVFLNGIKPTSILIPQFEIQNTLISNAPNFEIPKGSKANLEFDVVCVENFQKMVHCPFMNGPVTNRLFIFLTVNGAVHSEYKVIEAEKKTRINFVFDTSSSNCLNVTVYCKTNAYFGNDCEYKFDLKCFEEDK